MMRPRPLHDNVWLLFPRGPRLIDGVLVDQRSPETWMDALVVETGPDVPQACGFGTGDTVIARLADGFPLEYDGLLLRSTPASKVLGVLEPDRD